MNSDSRHLRLGMLGIVGLTLLVTLLARLWFLQMTAADTFQVEAQANRTRSVTLEAPRGRILDVNGRVLVDNRQSIVVTVDARVLADLEDQPGISDGGAAVAGATQRPGQDPVPAEGAEDSEGDVTEPPTARDALLDRLGAELTRFGVPTDREFLDARFNDDRFDRLLPIPVAEDVSEEFEIFLRERQDEFPGVSVDRVWVRTYPFGSQAAHILGYIGPVTPEELADREDSDLDYQTGDEIGKTGIERIFEGDLRGQPGVQFIEVDASDTPVRMLDARSSAPRQGNDVRLTIDIDLQAQSQNLLEQALIDARRREPEDPEDPDFDAPGGAVVVMDPNDGSILALASAPTFDPDIFVNGVSQADWEELNDPGAFSPLVNRATEGLYAPGSTFKPFVAHAAVSSGFLDPVNDTFLDEGRYRVEECTGGTCVFRNAGDVAYGQVDLQRALTVSSDAFFYWIGESFWSERTTGRAFGDPISDSAKEFGFGSSTGVQLTNERVGFVPDPDASRERHEENPEAFPFGDEWFAGNNVITAIGQGDVLVTPLQLANAYAAIANGGQLLAPSVVHDVLASGSQDVVRSFSTRTVAEVSLPPRIRAPLIAGLRGVTAEQQGTADQVFAGFPLEAWPIAGKTGTAEVGGKADTSLFAAFGPLPEPEYVVVALLEESGFGGDAAAPLTRELFDVLAGVEPPVKARSVEESLDEFLEPPVMRVPRVGNSEILSQVRDIVVERPTPEPEATEESGSGDGEDGNDDGAQDPEGEAVAEEPPVDTSGDPNDGDSDAAIGGPAPLDGDEPALDGDGGGAPGDPVDDPESVATTSPPDPVEPPGQTPATAPAEPSNQGEAADPTSAASNQEPLPSPTTQDAPPAQEPDAPAPEPPAVDARTDAPAAPAETPVPAHSAQDPASQDPARPDATTQDPSTPGEPQPDAAPPEVVATAEAGVANAEADVEVGGG